MIPFILFPFFMFAAYSSRRISWIWALLLVIISCAEVYILYTFPQQVIPNGDSWKNAYLIHKVKGNVADNPWICVAFLAIPCFVSLAVSYIKSIALWGIFITHIAMIVLGAIFFSEITKISTETLLQMLCFFVLGEIYFLGVFLALFGARVWCSGGNK